MRGEAETRPWGVFRRLLRPPAGKGYEIPTREKLAARALHTALVGILVWMVPWFAVFIPFFVANKAATFGFSIAFLGMVCLSFAALRKGRVKLASWLFVLTLWPALVVDAFVSGGNTSHAITGLLGLTVVVAWLFTYEVSIIGSGLFIGTTLAFALLQQRGYPLPTLFPGPPLAVWALLCLHLAVATLPVRQVLRALQRSLLDTANSALFNKAVRDSLAANIAVLNDRGVIVATNRAWNQFAEQNDGTGLLGLGVGANYLEVCAKAAASGDGLAGQALTGIEALRAGTRENFTLEYPCDSPSEKRWFVMNATRLGNTDKSLVVSHVDISERKRAEQALRESEEGLRALNEELERRVTARTKELEDARRAALSLLQDTEIHRQRSEEALVRLEESTRSQVMLWQAVETSPTIVVITDTNGAIQYVNPKFVEVTGYTADEVKGRTPGVLKSGVHPKEFYTHLWTTVTAGQTWVGEFCNRRKNGELYWETASISPVRTADGQVRQFLAIKEDVTALRRAAEELRRAKEAAEDADRAKSRFLASMSHEIRTPLNAIIGYSQLLERDGALAEQARQHVHVIGRSGHHLLGLLNDVLEVSKIDAGTVRVAPSECDLHLLLDDLVAMFRVRAEEKRLALVVERQQDLPRYIQADQGKIRQVLVNLLGNAVKFTDHGRVSLRVSINRTESGQQRLAFEVADTGAGISSEEMNSLFRYFEQTESGRRQQAGTGLGLVISREYARLMGGDISVASEKGKGSTFRFEAPAVILTGHSDNEGVRSGVARLSPGQIPPKILVVDDEPTNRGWLVAMLESVGFRVREATNGEEAVRACESWRPGLVLMDIRMPGMDGVTATKRVRELAHGSSIVIIALTASSLGERMEDAAAMGMDDVVYKPFQCDVLFDKIRERLGIEYQYADVAGIAAPPADVGFRGAPSADGIVGPLRTTIVQAIEACDFDALMRTLPEVEAQSVALAARIRGLASSFDYDALAVLFGKGR